MKRTLHRQIPIVAAAWLALWTPCLGGEPGKAGQTPATSNASADKSWSTETLDLTKDWGIEILGIRLTAANYMLDFRYKVTDPKKAAPIFERQNKPALIDQKSGQRFLVASSPTVGPLRPSNTPQPGRTYFMMFGNPGAYLKSGGRVSVRIGPFLVKDLTIR